MKKLYLVLLLLAAWSSLHSDTLNDKLQRLPVFDALASQRTPYDWLLEPAKSCAEVYRSADGKSLILANGMVWRTFRITPNLATTDYVNRMTGERMLRAVSPEGSITLDGHTYSIGGLKGQQERGYLLEQWIAELTAVDSAFQVCDFEVRPLQSRIPWKKVRWSLVGEPDSGTELVFTLRGQGELSRVTILLHVGLYDHLPVLRKSLELLNESGQTVNVDAFRLEQLAFFEPDSPSGMPVSSWLLPNIHVETDYQMRGSFTEKETDRTEHWTTDPQYTSQRNYGLQTPCILQVYPETGPDQPVPAQQTFQSFAVYEMPFDSWDRERKGLFTRRMRMHVSPWTTQNPIFLHLLSSDPAVIRQAVDQCVEVGYEMIIISFGSGLNMEDTSPANISRWKEMVDYARSRGIEMGCYSLLASRRVNDESDCINPTTGKTGGMTFGNSPCLCSQWGEDYFRRLETFLDQTGMMCLEHDGSYPGDLCASKAHPYHRGLLDSQWNQMRRITQFYHRLSAAGVYMNVPDFYLMNGTTKTSIGYREANWSLPRERQLIHSRQLLYDCTWENPVGAMWSFVPLVQYHGGGSAATLEPLSQHLQAYKMHMVQNYGAGIQACYRGPRLYDTDETKQMVSDVISWYKKYRRILNSDIIHLRKPDARDWDGLMHVSTEGPEHALAMLYNPLDQDIRRTVTLPLYYTGLRGKVHIREQEGAARKYKLNAQHEVTLTVDIPARGYTWLVVE
jgi:hypothetical protein